MGVVGWARMAYGVRSHAERCGAAEGTCRDGGWGACEPIRREVVAMGGLTINGTGVGSSRLEWVAGFV